MTAEEIYELARKKQPAPDGMTLSEQLLYSIARNTYKAFADGVITIEQAKLEKAQSVKAFGVNALSERVMAEHSRRMAEISRVLQDAEKCGCEYCKRVSRIFDGREAPAHENEGGITQSEKRE